MPSAKQCPRTLTAWLALAGLLAALLCGLPGLSAARADEGATATPIEAAPTDPAPTETQFVETSEPTATDPAAATDAPTDTLEPSATGDGLTGTPTAVTETPPTDTETPTPLYDTPTATLDAPTATATASPTTSATATGEDAATATPTLDMTATAPETPTPTSTASPQQAASPTSSPSPTLPYTHIPTLPPPRAAAAGDVAINEIVTDPQSDWSGSGFGFTPGSGPVNEADAYVELRLNASGLNLAGWTITLDDGTPSSGSLAAGGAFGMARYVGAGSPAYTFAGDRLVLGGPADAIGNTVLVTLRDAGDNVIDQVQVGAGGAPGGGATGPADESIGRFPDGADSDDDQADFAQQPGTPGFANQAGPPATATAIAYPPLAVVINEVAWAGTAASSSDEWIELYNPGAAPVSLLGWLLSAPGQLSIPLDGLVVTPGGYLLLERTSDATVSDIAADRVYTGALVDSGMRLDLYDGAGSLIDTANASGGPWPAGDGATHASMERRSPGADTPGNWQTHTGQSQAGHDALGQALRGTARAANSGAPPPPPTVAPGTRVLLNEFLAAPTSGGEEFIELFNAGGAAVDLAGWMLDDAPGGSGAYVLPAGTVLGPGGLLAFSQAVTGLALNNDGDTVRVLRPDGTPADEFTYASSRGGVSWARLPDGGNWSSNGLPTPGQPNREVPGPPEPDTVSIGVVRGWNDGAWVTVAGRVSVPPGVFSTRTIQVQDDTGGVTVYLGRGEWPPLVVGQPIRLVLGYLRHRSGNLEVYVRNVWHVRAGPVDGLPPLRSWPVRTGVAAGTASGVPAAPNSYAGALVSVLGPVTRVEAQAFWLDDGAGPLRVFFPASAGVPRPPVRTGQTWRVTGIVMEVAPASPASPRYRLQPRAAADLAQVVGGVDVVYAVTPVATAPATPEPTATDER
jgi:hypothetical protein